MTDHECNGPTMYRAYSDPGRGEWLWPRGNPELTAGDAVRNAPTGLGPITIVSVCKSPIYSDQFVACGGAEAVRRVREVRERKPGDIGVGKVPDGPIGVATVVGVEDLPAVILPAVENWHCSLCGAWFEAPGPEYPGHGCETVEKPPVVPASTAMARAARGLLADRVQVARDAARDARPADYPLFGALVTYGETTGRVIVSDRGLVVVEWGPGEHDVYFAGEWRRLVDVAGVGRPAWVLED